MLMCQTSDRPEAPDVNKIAPLKVALVSNPNCGKTTLFNALTGAQQRVGNWAGVTVEQASAYGFMEKVCFEVIDLPGLYALDGVSSQGAIDECLAYTAILQQPIDLLINVIAAHNLERHLYLTTQLLEMHRPLIVVLNMMDVAKARAVNIDVSALTVHLKVPVVPMVAHRKADVRAFKKILVQYIGGAMHQGMQCGSTPLDCLYTTHPSIAYISEIVQAIQSLATILASYVIKSSPTELPAAQSTRILGTPDPGPVVSNLEEPCLSVTVARKRGATWVAMRLLEGDPYLSENMPTPLLEAVQEQQQSIQRQQQEDPDILIAHARYQWITQIIAACVHTPPVPPQTWSARIDAIVLNRIWGIPIFLGVMYSLFACAISLGGQLQDWVNIGSQAIFVDAVVRGLEALHAPGWSVAILAYGLGKGINTVLTFIPILSILFFLMAFLEDSGYMMRAAFVVDRVMLSFGLPGKAFVPMMVGLGCNVPAVMAARVLENKRDRILAIMMSPFMSCSARLAIYTVFTATFFPLHGSIIVFSLYLIGIIMAMVTGGILRHTLLLGPPTPLIMELPAYHYPQFKNLLLHAWQRLRGFLMGASRVILPVCILIGTLNEVHLPVYGGAGQGETISVLALIGHKIHPLFAPMGIQPDNWPATVGLLTGILAKEVVIGTLNTLYVQQAHVLLATSQGINIVPSATQLMYTQFGGTIPAFAYLLFVLLYFPCISTSAVMIRELHWGWALLSVIWMTSIAYSIAVLFYQLATFNQHPLLASSWLAGVLAVLCGAGVLLKKYSQM